MTALIHIIAVVHLSYQPCFALRFMFVCFSNSNSKDSFPGFHLSKHRWRFSLKLTKLCDRLQASRRMPGQLMMSGQGADSSTNVHVNHPHAAVGARARYGCGHGDPFLADYRDAYGGRRIRDGFDLRQLSITRYGTGRVGKKLCLEPRNIHV